MALGFGPGTVEGGAIVGGVGHEQMHHVVETSPGHFAVGDPLPGIWYHLGFASLWATGFLLIGYAFFMSRKNKFSDLV